MPISDRIRRAMRSSFSRFSRAGSRNSCNIRVMFFSPVFRRDIPPRHKAASGPRSSGSLIVRITAPDRACPEYQMPGCLLNVKGCSCQPPVRPSGGQFLYPGFLEHFSGLFVKNLELHTGHDIQIGPPNLKNLDIAQYPNGGRCHRIAPKWIISFLPFVFPGIGAGKDTL